MSTAFPAGNVALSLRLESTSNVAGVLVAGGIDVTAVELLVKNLLGVLLGLFGSVCNDC